MIWKERGDDDLGFGFGCCQAPRAYAMMGSVLSSSLIGPQTEKAIQAYEKALDVAAKRNQ